MTYTLSPARLRARRARDAVRAALHGGPLATSRLVALACDLCPGLSAADVFGAIAEQEAYDRVNRALVWYPDGHGGWRVRLCFTLSGTRGLAVTVPTSPPVVESVR